MNTSSKISCNYHKTWYLW